jgi:aspartyl/asparaginyl beta-hydroxylase (cupin superfamily)
MRHLANVIEQMRSGGYYDRVMSGGAELDRVKAFLLACAGERAGDCADPMMRPHYPCFPGLRNRPWHDPSEFEAVRILEASFAAIRDEALRLRDDTRVDYRQGGDADAAPRMWTLHLLYHMGVNVESATGQCPKTLAVVHSLPRACLGYPWGDVVFSAMNPGGHLRAHCSIDNLRVRVHLGIVIPGDCSMRVKTETRTWEEGRCLAFEDAFEHEVWNRSNARRIVFIVDLWHPDLTDIEVRALTAGFRKAQVRRAFMAERIGMTDSPHRYLPVMESALRSQDDDPVVREFWPG